MTIVRRSALATLSSLLLLLGCSSGEDKGSNQGAACIERADECFASQRICVANGAAETCEQCPLGQYALSADECAPIPGVELKHDFGATTLLPAEEKDGWCQSWTLGNETELWINAVEMENDGWYHHSNWLFVPDTMYADGSWRCGSLGYDELSAAAAGGVLFAQSTQTSRQVQKFPNGVAVRIPPRARIIGGTHLLNTSADTVNTALQMNLFTIDRADVQVPLAPFRLSYMPLYIQPASITTVTSECDFTTATIIGASTATLTPGDLDMDLYYAMPHYHYLGSSFRLERFGGANDGELLYELGAFDSEAHGVAFDPPISMRNSSGFRFTCGFDNPHANPVYWGIGDVNDPTQVAASDAGEMCVMLGFTRAAFAFDGHVLKDAGYPSVAEETATRVSSANGVYAYEKSCGTIALPFTDKQGGL